MTLGGLEILIGLPIGGAALVAVLPGETRRVQQLAVAVATVSVAASVWAWASVAGGAPGYHFQSSAAWVEPLGVRWRLGMDSLSAPLVVLTSALTWCCLVSLVRRAPDCGGRRALTALILVVEAGSIATFVSLDLVVFFIAFETVLIPMWFVIADWGDQHDAPGRRRAATRFLVATVVGSALMLIGFLLLHAATGTFDLTRLGSAADGMSVSRQAVVAAVLMVGFGAKMPLWPLHFWLPDAHAKAPTVGSVLLAGVLLKLGTYGLLRLWYDAVPAGATRVAPYLGALGVVGIVYGCLACLAQTDLKRLIAYSSIGHMGFVALAISTMTPQGLAAANFANVAHGVVTGLLFFVVGGVKDRVGSTGLSEIGRGLYGRSPHLAGLLGFAAMASLGLPGLAGFWGEILTMLAAYAPNPALPRTTYLVFMALAGIGAVLTTVYFAGALRRVCQGVPDKDALPGVGRDEWLAWSPLLLLTVALGVYPTLMLWSADQGAAVLPSVVR